MIVSSAFVCRDTGLVVPLEDTVAAGEACVGSLKDLLVMARRVSSCELIPRHQKRHVITNRFDYGTRQRHLGHRQPVFGPEPTQGWAEDKCKLGAFDCILSHEAVLGMGV